MSRRGLLTAPHQLSGDSTAHWMWAVCLCLAPAAVYGVAAFGWHAGLVVLASVASALVWEGLAAPLFRRGFTLGDGSAALTGLLIGLSMPPQVPLHIVVIGNAFAIIVVKQAFGGLGFNIFNPAMAARTFVSMIWVKEMTTWAEPFTVWQAGGAAKVAAVSSATVDAIAGATPQELIFNNTSRLTQAGIESPLPGLAYLGMEKNYWDMFLGNISGSIGEVSALLLLIGAIYLFIKRIITWDVVVSFLGAVLLFGWVWGGWTLTGKWFAGDPLFYLLSGATLFTAIFIVTDIVTNPATPLGRVIFGFGCGLLSVAIKVFTYYPEGTMFAVLIMNVFTPLINWLIRPQPLGYARPTARNN